MFAHQVIEDIIRLDNFRKKGLTKEESSIEVYLDYQHNLIKYIKNSQQFYLNYVDEMMESAKRTMSGTKLFYGENGKVRLPYKSCWFEYCRKIQNGGSKKVGILTIELEKDLWNCYLFYVDAHGFWGMHPIICWVGIDKVLSDFRDFFKKDEQWSFDFNILASSILESNRSIELDSIWIDSLSVLNTATMFLSCKNISTENILPSKSLNLKRIKHGKTPLFSYHILVIKPTGKKQESIPKNLWQNRIHLCRGHFKTYTVEHPLFGNLVGRYWWQAQARGHKEKGIVMKDYELSNFARKGVFWE